MQGPSTPYLIASGLTVTMNKKDEEISCNDFVRLFNTHELVSKQLPNSPILKINHKLDSIEVKKGRIHRE